MGRPTPQPWTDIFTRRRFWAGAGLIVLMTCLAYIPAVMGGFVWDDDMHVTHNPLLASVEGLWRIWTEVGAHPQYYPLSLTGFWVQFQLWGGNAAGYHVVNILLHALSAALLLRILYALSVPGAWFAAALFAVHPVHVESVAWISELKNVLSGFFYLAAFWFALKAYSLTTAEDARDEDALPDIDWRSYTLSFVCFVLALLSKTVTATFPAALLLVIWWRRARIRRLEAVSTIPMFAAGIGMGLLTVVMEQHLGATGLTWELSFVERILVAGRAVWFYAEKLAWPFPLIFNYPRWDIDASALWQYLYPAAFLALVCTLFALRRRIGRGPLTAVLFFAGTLFPALGFFAVYPMRYSYVADHFQYLASIGLLTLAAGIAATYLCRLDFSDPKHRYVLVAAVSAVFLLFGVQTWRQSLTYENKSVLYQDILHKNPDSFLAHNNLGDMFDRSGNLDMALKHYSEALRIKPDFYEGYYNIGNALMRRGRYQEAIPMYEQALELNPRDHKSHFNLGVTMLRMDQIHQAIQHFQDAVRIRPDYVNAHLALGKLYFRLGNYSGSLPHFRQVLHLDPDNGDARTHLDRARRALGG